MNNDPLPQKPNPNLDLTKFDLNKATFNLSAPKAQKIKDCFEFDRYLRGLFTQESKKLALTPERYEYTPINELYKSTDPIIDTHYLLYDSGPAIMRGLLGNVLGKVLKEDGGADLGKMFEATHFKLARVLETLPGVDVPGYANLHVFLNAINPELQNHNLLIAYMRQDDPSFSGGYTDYLGLIEGIAGEGMGKVSAGDVELFPVESHDENNQIVSTLVQGGTLWMAPIASSQWSFDLLDDMSDDEIREAPADEIPLRDRSVDTFHYLNGVTPHYFRTHLENAFSKLRLHSPSSNSGRKNEE